MRARVWSYCGSAGEATRDQAPHARTFQDPVHSEPRYSRQASQGGGSLRHSIPNGDPAANFNRGLTLLLADLARPGSRLPPVHELVTRGRLARDTCPPQSSARYGIGTAANVHFGVLRGAAVKQDFSNSIMLSRTPRAARPLLKTWNCAAVHITSTNQSSNFRIGGSRRSRVKFERATDKRGSRPSGCHRGNDPCSRHGGNARVEVDYRAGLRVTRADLPEDGWVGGGLRLRSVRTS